ncbi:MAG: L-serine ammonia-lyase, iron-sulfur-dependent, subunit beta [Bacillaceae bacterium]|nr:L-serine ammonia-lyase, iron-sulfur-dependent, subunit beta [Bacillaceae bacterium]
MKYRSVFDIIGPVMIGPSSSHTAGAARIGRAARKLFNRQPKKAEIYLYGSFAKTYQGHGTDVAIVGGILDFDPHDRRIVDSLKIAEEAGIEITIIPLEENQHHPNTATIKLMDDEGEIELTGSSIGGGKIEITNINGFDISLSGNSPALIVFHEDRFGMIASVARILADNRINIGKMEMSRKSRGHDALMIIETDQKVSDQIMDQISNLPHVHHVFVIFP